MNTSDTIVALMNALREQGFSFTSNISADSFNESWDFLPEKKKKVMDVLHAVSDWTVSYDKINHEAFSHDMLRLNELSQDLILSWAYKSGSLCVALILSGDKMSDDEIVRFFKRFDEVVVTDMSKHAGKGAMDTKLGTFGTLFVVFSDSVRSMRFRETCLKKCFESHFMKTVYCSTMMVDCPSGIIVQGKGTFGSKWSGGIEVSLVAGKLNDLR